MKLIRSGDIHYYCFENLLAYNLPHAVMTRRGGVSGVPWATLNVGATVGDEIERVKENRKRAFEAIGRNVEAYYDVWQVHSNDIVYTDAPRPANIPHVKADGIFTNNPKVTLFMRFADCVPVLLFDPQKRVVGCVHAGWMGTVSHIVAVAIQKMKNEYGTKPTDIIAGIGPSICQNHYEVGEEVINKAKASFGETAELFIRRENGHSYLNLWEANKYLLIKNGVKNIEVSGICTACHLDDWFSHRGEAGKTGRFGVMIGL